MGWIYLNLPGSDAEPVRFVDDPDVIASAQAKGYERVDEPVESVASESVEPDEVDVHGQGWVYLTHHEVGGSARYPVEVAAELFTQGWELPSAQESAPALEDQTVVDLRAQLKELGLSTSGNKQELIDRLYEYDDQAPVEPETEEQ